MILKFFTSEIVDKYVRENFKKLDDYFRKDVFRKGGFKFFTYTADEARNLVGAFPKTITARHTLGFMPKDVIQLSVFPFDTVVTWRYDDFTNESVVFDLDQACTLRAYIGAFGDNA